MENRVAIYCRLSKEDEEKTTKDDESESIQNQKLLLTDYAASQGWTIYKIYSDDDYSGLDRDRPAFKKMIADVKRGLIDIVLCKTQSRFTRDMELVEKYIHGLFHIQGTRFIGLVDHIDTDMKGNKKQRQIYGLVNEWYCEDASDNIRATFKRKMEEGQFLGSFAPYGYSKDPNDRHKLVVDDEAASIVKEIYRLYLSGNGCAKIADVLTSRGVPTPSAYKEMKLSNFKNPNSVRYSVSFGIWPRNTVRRILQDKTYIGCIIQGREKKVSYKSKKVIHLPESEWIVVENCHTPIIDEKSFYCVQNLLSKKRTLHKPTHGYKGITEAHIFTGKIRCLDCGANMLRGTPSRDGITYHLHCSLASKTKTKNCTAHSIKLATLASVVERKIKEIMNGSIQNKDTFEIIKKALADRSGFRKEVTIKQKELSGLDKKIEEENRFIMALYKDKVNGVLSEDEFLNMKATMQQEIEKCRNQKIKLEEDMNALNLRYASLENIDVALSQHIDFQTLTHEIVNDFIDYIEIGEKNENAEQKIVINWLF